jgi:ribosomal protein L37E
VIVCQRCGHSNEDHSSFCESCGSFLEWAGVAPAETGGEPDQPAPITPEQTSAAGAESAGAPPSTPAPGVGPLPVLAPGATTGTPSSDTAPTATAVEQSTESVDQGATGTQGGSETLGEEVDETGAPESVARTSVPEARLPGARQPAPTRARGATRRSAAVQPLVLPGQEVCPSCGIGNDRTRTFCRRCGVMLHPDTSGPERLTWWQRLLRWLSARRRHELKAGERPGQHRRLLPRSAPGWLSGTIARVVTLVVVVFAILATVGPVHRPIDRKLGQWKDDVLLAVHPTYDPVHPISATATSSLAGHPPQLVIDGLSNTFWATGPTDNGIGTTLTIRFSSPTTINRVGFLVGDQSTPASYLSEPRPELVHLAFSARPNTGTTLLLADSAKFQTFSLDAKDATEMTLTIDSVYPSATGHDCAITQLEFFTKRP